MSGVNSPLLGHWGWSIKVALLLGHRNRGNRRGVRGPRGLRGHFGVLDNGQLPKVVEKLGIRIAAKGEHLGVVNQSGVAPAN